MKAAQRRKQGKGALDLIEEATHLLRTAPPATLAGYGVGAIPFVLGLLYFWADMSRSPFAHQHQAEASLGLAGLFLWMKFWQAVFARGLRAQIAAEQPPRWTARRCGRVLLSQVLVQSSGLFVLPLAILPALPWPWVYAFYQNATVLADGESGPGSKLLKDSWKQAALWPRQNHLALGILLLFGFCVFLNCTLVGWILPQLGKMLFGIESVFTRSPFAMLNTTFFAAMAGLTYLCVDPIVKAVYVLRCFYGESLQSGEDLKAEVRQYAGQARRAAGGVALLVLMLGAVPARGADSPSPPVSAAPGSPPAVSPAELDEAISRTIQQRKFTWRLPRDTVADPKADQGVIARFLTNVGSVIRDWLRAARDWLEELFRKLFPRKSPSENANASGYGWIMMLEILLYALALAAAVALAVLIYRTWRKRQRGSDALKSEPIQPAPDISDENIGAEQLPEDGWTKLARELLERGELRLALRAFYLASLAHLAERNLIRIARFKSNRDYERELGRRGHSFPQLLADFGENVSVFERIWYGMHDINREGVDRFAANLERIKTAG